MTEGYSASRRNSLGRTRTKLRVLSYSGREKADGGHRREMRRFESTFTWKGLFPIRIHEKNESGRELRLQEDSLHKYPDLE